MAQRCTKAKNVRVGVCGGREERASKRDNCRHASRPANCTHTHVHAHTIASSSQAHAAAAAADEPRRDPWLRVLLGGQSPLTHAGRARRTPGGPSLSFVVCLARARESCPRFGFSAIVFGPNTRCVKSRVRFSRAVVSVNLPDAVTAGGFSRLLKFLFFFLPTGLPPSFSRSRADLVADHRRPHENATPCVPRCALSVRVLVCVRECVFFRLQPTRFGFHRVLFPRFSARAVHKQRSPRGVTATAYPSGRWQQLPPDRVAGASGANGKRAARTTFVGRASTTGDREFFCVPKLSPQSTGHRRGNVPAAENINERTQFVALAVGALYEQ